MGSEYYRYEFAAEVPMSDVRESLLLAVLAVECLEGRAEVRLNASFHVELGRRAACIDASTPIGSKIALIFTGFLSHEFGEEAFRVKRNGVEGHHRSGASGNGTSP